MIGEKAYSLSSILEEVYKKDKNNINKKTKEYKNETEAGEEQKYQNFKAEKTKDLKKICKTLGIELNDFVGNNGYNIPEIVKDIIEEYLSIEGVKGGFVSKLRNGKLDDINSIEKKEFVVGLKERIQNNKEYTKDKKEIIEKMLDMNLYNISFLAFMDARQAMIVNHAVETIHNDVTKLRNKNYIDGLIRFTNAEKMDKEINKQLNGIEENNTRNVLTKPIKNPMNSIRNILDDSDIDVLIDVYEELINEASEKWKQIINYFEDIKLEFIEKEAKEKKDSRVILKQVLKEIGVFENPNYEDKLLKAEEDIKEILQQHIE